MEHKHCVISDLFLSCMCKRFLDLPGTKILVLVGKEVFTKIRRRINDSDVSTICLFLSKNPKVAAVNLAYNDITDVGMMQIVNFLQENSSIIDLNLMNNDIKEDASSINELSKLKTMTSLKSLRLNGNKIGPKGLKSLAMMLSVNQTLTNLDVGETDQTLESLVFLAAALRTSNCGLQALTVNRVLGPPGHVLQTDQVAAVLQRTLAVNNTLRELHLQKIGFLDHDIELLVEGLKQNSTLLLLDLSCNNIRDFGMECIAEYLGMKPPLSTLLVGTNEIGDTGARSLSFKFPYSKVIFMDISNNKMTDEGLLDILNCLKKEHPLQGLFMRGNRIGEKTCKVLFRMILSGVLFDKTLDVNVYQEQDRFAFSCTESADHLMPHYYCLCMDTGRKFCRHCTIMDIRNK